MSRKHKISLILITIFWTLLTYLIISKGSIFGGIFFIIILICIAAPIFIDPVDLFNRSLQISKIPEKEKIPLTPEQIKIFFEKFINKNPDLKFDY